VLAVDYLMILPPEGHDPAAPPPADIAAWGRVIAARLAAATRSAADAADWGYVPASAASADHHAARCRSTLAPHLAPSELVSAANVR
jgi:hypothetical protein